MQIPGKMSLALALAATAMFSHSVSAHDGWLQPDRFTQTNGAPVTLSFRVGHGAHTNTVAIGPTTEWIDSLSVTSPDGETRDLPAPRIASSEKEGVYLVTLTTRDFENQMGAEAFNRYLKREGLTPAIEHRERHGHTGKPGREVFSRVAKSLVQLGESDNAAREVLQPSGLELEIVPECVPSSGACGDTLPLRVYYQGEPLANARVTFNDLDANEWPTLVQHTDADGRALFPLAEGRWLAAVTWTRPEKTARGDFKTVLSSLSFAH